MKNSNFDIKEYLKPNKCMVVELDDEVEYILDNDATKAIENGEDKINLIRVIDRKSQSISLRRIKWALLKNGVIDYLDKEKV